MPGPPPRTPSEELEALGGPVKLIAIYQARLVARLAHVLEQRQSIKMHLGWDADAAEEEIEKICALFLANIQGDVRQMILEVYKHRAAPPSAPTLPYGSIRPVPRPVKPAEALEDFRDLFEEPTEPQRK